MSARLDALPPQERSVLLDASIVGKVFWRGALERMGESGIVLAEALDSLEARDLIRHEPRSWIEREDQFTFKYALIRDVAYATLPRAQAQGAARHRWRVPRGGDERRGATATALARHWREAGDHARALEYLLLAADQAGRGWAKDEAAALYGEALELPDLDPERRRELVRKRALALAAFQHVADMRYLSRPAESEPSDVFVSGREIGGGDVPDNLGDSQHLVLTQLVRMVTNNCPHSALHRDRTSARGRLP